MIGSEAEPKVGICFARNKLRNLLYLGNWGKPCEVNLSVGYDTFEGKGTASSHCSLDRPVVLSEPPLAFIGVILKGVRVCLQSGNLELL